MMRILLAEDHNLVRKDITNHLRERCENSVVSEAATLPDALRRVEIEEAFDLIVLDLGMPGMPGLEGIRAARRAAPDTPVVLLSGSIDPAVAVEALAVGAQGVIARDLKGKAVTSAVEPVLSGERSLPSSVAGQALQKQAHEAEGRLRLRQRLGGLTEREYDVIELLAKGFGNKRISDELGVAEGTIKLHISHIFTKCSARNRSDAVRIFFQTADKI